MHKAWAVALLLPGLCCSLLLLVWNGIFPLPVGQHARPDARFRSTTFLPVELPPRDTGLTSALAYKLRHLSYSQPRLQMQPEMNTIGKMLEYGVQNSLRRFAQGKGSAIMSSMQPKENNKWSNISTCQDRSAWQCLFGRPKTPHKHNRTWLRPFYREDIARAQEVLQWETEEHQLIFAGAVAAALAPHIHHVPYAVRRIINVPSERNINISLHGRFSDSCDYLSSELRRYGQLPWDDRGRPCFTFDTYTRELGIISTTYRTRNVLVATDSQDFLDYLLADKSYNYWYIEANRSVYKPTTSGRNGWIDNRLDLSSAMVDSSLSDLWLLQYGHVLLGGLSGHFSRALYYLMAGRLGYAPRYRSLDGGAPIWYSWRAKDFVQAAQQGPDPWQPQWQVP